MVKGDRSFFERVGEHGSIASTEPKLSAGYLQCLANHAKQRRRHTLPHCRGRVLRKPIYTWIAGASEAGQTDGALSHRSELQLQAWHQLTPQKRTGGIQQREA